MALYVKFECKTCENENCYGHSLPTTEKVCDGYKHTDTNADRIRAMTDEELADLYIRAIEDEEYPGWWGNRMGLLAWLKQEAKDDGSAI